ncbi:hypothetical protein [Uliginosibacterium gangwonense]|uniref:hypothetical protein n=1 Tax=Uliginosibacterium gangwonense TaxID=392736 RepID=UPI001B7FDA12|nr:hypothetical protein [Uliginosibacterium gangwonense]
MSLREKLADSEGSLATATDYPPNDYPVWSYWTYETHMADLKELWAEIRESLKRDHDKVPFIDEKLQEAFAAFDAGEKDRGVKAILAIYNLEVDQLR